MQMMNYKSSILDELCSSIKKNKNGNHSCERCMQLKDVEAIAKHMKEAMYLGDKNGNEVEAIVDE